MTSNPSGGSAKWLQVQQEASPVFEANPVKSMKPVNHSFGPVGTDCGRVKSPSSAERLRQRAWLWPPFRVAAGEALRAEPRLQFGAAATWSCRTTAY